MKFLLVWIVKLLAWQRRLKVLRDGHSKSRRSMYHTARHQRIDSGLRCTRGSLVGNESVRGCFQSVFLQNVNKQLTKYATYLVRLLGRFRVFSYGMLCFKGDTLHTSCRSNEFLPLSAFLAELWHYKFLKGSKISLTITRLLVSWKMRSFKIW